jgi:hypothetical protein
LFEVQKELRNKDFKLSNENRTELEKLLGSEIKTISEKIRSWSENFEM